MPGRFGPHLFSGWFAGRFLGRDVLLFCCCLLIVVLRLVFGVVLVSLGILYGSVISRSRFSVGGAFSLCLWARMFEVLAGTGSSVRVVGGFGGFVL
jgi:hypothetical protein